MSPIGSSPHARGTLCRARDQFSCWRFIPACAGNAFFGPIRICFLPVHPRMRGERSGQAPCCSLSFGSSPHARGTRHDGTRRRALARFIPACAGNALTGFWRRQTLPVHPRMRGERFHEGRHAFLLLGSSPHARGTCISSRARFRWRRFILACAGNTCRGNPRPFRLWVHPRMRGKHSSSRALFHNMIHKIKEPTD